MLTRSEDVEVNRDDCKCSHEQHEDAVCFNDLLLITETSHESIIPPYHRPLPVSSGGDLFVPSK